jgi:hypothetical protein
MGMKEDLIRNIGFICLAIFLPGIIVGNAHTPIRSVGWEPRAWTVRQYRSTNFRSLNRRRDSFAQSRGL